MGFFVCFCSSETSSVCSSSDTGLFTNDEGRQGNNCPVIFLMCCWGISLNFFYRYKERSMFEEAQRGKYGREASGWEALEVEK